MPAPVAAPPAPASVSPESRALGRLAALEAREPNDAAGVAHDVVEVSSIVRDYVVERTGVRARERTTDEARVATAPALGAPRAARLGDVLSRCDLVKFAGAAAGASGRADLLASARGFVATPPGGAATGAPS
jgi:hypothetical protein